MGKVTGYGLIVGTRGVTSISTVKFDAIQGGGLILEGVGTTDLVVVFIGNFGGRVVSILKQVASRYYLIYRFIGDLVRDLGGDKNGQLYCVTS